jgi:hypothetical protein
MKILIKIITLFGVPSTQNFYSWQDWAEALVGIVNVG